MHLGQLGWIAVTTWPDPQRLLVRSMVLEVCKGRGSFGQTDCWDEWTVDPLIGGIRVSRAAQG